MNINFHQCYGFKFKNKKGGKQTRYHGTGQTAEWNDLTFCMNNQYDWNWRWLVFGRKPVKTDRMVAILKFKFKNLKLRNRKSEERNGRNFGITWIVNELSKTFFFKNNFAHISATVRDRAKRTNFWDHMYCRYSQQICFQHFFFLNLEKHNLRIQSLITKGMRCFCAQAQKQVDKGEIYLAISSFYCHQQYCFKFIN